MFKSKKRKMELALLILVIILVIIFVLFGSDIIRVLNDAGIDIGGTEQSGTTGQGDDGSTPSSGVVDLDESSFSVHFVNVGQGDAIIVRLPDGVDIIVDAGSGTSERSAVTEDYLAYLRGIDIGTIDYVIATHAHSDHMNMLNDVVEEFPIKEVIYNDFDVTPTTAYFKSFLTAVEAEEGCTTRKIAYDGEVIKIEPTDSTYDYCVTLFCQGYGGLDDDNLNNDSPMILVEYAGRSVLLTGDAEVEAEELFMDYCTTNNIDINVDVLKSGHHGSKTSSGYEFLEFIDAEYAVICTGENKYGHPNEETMDSYTEYGIATYLTDTHGDIVFVVDADGNFVFMVQNAVPTKNNSKNFEEYMEQIGG